MLEISQPLSTVATTTAVVDIMDENSFDNSSELQNKTDNDDLNYFWFYENIQHPLMWIIFVAIMIGNSSVITVMLRTKSRKSKMNYFILQLAIADLFVGVNYLFTDILQRITIVWNAGVFACKMMRLSQAMGLYASSYVLVALSIDRCDAITNPMNFSGSWLRARILIGTAWLLSVVFSVPVLLLYDVKEVQNKLQCWIELGTPFKWQLWVTLISLTIFVVPALIIAACYTVIVLTIWTKSKAVVMSPAYNTKKMKVNRNGISADLDSDMESRRASSRGLIPRAKIKSVKMTFVIVFVFILCWLPYFVFDLLQVYQMIPTTQEYFALATLVQCLAPLNSAANPIICCLFSPHICHEISRLPPYSWFFTQYCGRQRRQTMRSRSNSTANSEVFSSFPRRSNRAHVTHSGATVLNSSRTGLGSSSSDLGSRRSQIIVLPSNKGKE